MPRVARAALLIAVVLGCAHGARAQEIPSGKIVDEVRCADDPSQSYALYVPSNYTPGRQWSVLFAFHPAARGRAMVELYAAAAERYGYIVAGSNNSRNGSGAASAGAVRSMPADVGRRLSIDPKRVYLTGMSGGARVALDVALANIDIAGVIASAAGYPDAKPRAKVSFPLYGTTGTEDFNYLEMRMLDRKLTTPHYLAIFNGGHGLPPAGVAMDAVEWMELQAMRSGRRARDEAFIDRLLDGRRKALAASTGDVETVHVLDALVADFQGLRDVSADAARVKDLRDRRDVRKALDREREDDEAELRMVTNIFELEALLPDEEERAHTMLQLRNRLDKLSQAANAAEDTPSRRQARRVLRAIVFGGAERVQDREYRALLDRYRQAGGR